MGSNYVRKVVNGSATSDSMNGLKFGQKIYFEDVGVGVIGKSRNGSSKKNGKNVSNNSNNSNSNGIPARCQVEGCNVDLSDSKAYYSRHKVCGMHSKSPLVVVSGLQQRFCQQCSRFHQLPEFDQGKRSCRRRLAGHNERRRKPPPGSLLSTRLGRLSSSLFGDSSTRSGFLLDFSAYSRQSERDLWPNAKISEAAVSGSQSTSPGKFHHNLWPGNSENPSSEMFLQSSTGGSSSYPIPIPSGECITGVSSDSTCALSLLSNQTWGSGGSTNGASDNTGLGSLMNHTSTQTVTVAHLPNIQEPDIGLHEHGQFSHPLSSDHLFMEQVHGGRHYMEVNHSNGQDHWSL